MKRSNGENIDQLFGQLLQLSAEDKYDFEEFRGDWGRSNGEKFNDMLSRFCENWQRAVR